MTAPRKDAMSEWIETHGFAPDLPVDTRVHMLRGGHEFKFTMAVGNIDWCLIDAYRLAVNQQEPSKCEYGHAWQAHNETCKECGMRWRDYRAVREGKQVTTCLHHPVQGDRGVYCLLCKETLSNAAQEHGGQSVFKTDSQESPAGEHVPAAAPNEGFDLSWAFPNLRGLVTNPALIKRLQEIAQEVQRGAAAPVSAGQHGDSLGAMPTPDREQSASHPLRRDVYGLKIKWPELREVTRHAAIETNFWRKWI